MAYNILITNDDGIYSEGISALYQVFSNDSLFNVYVVSPSTEYSACSHTVTLRKPISSQEITTDKVKGIAVSGSPADCVKLAILNIYAEINFDLVISGINPGRNNGVCVHYSGTVAGAKEAALFRIPSISVSIMSTKDANFLAIAEFLKKFVTDNMIQIKERKSFLNINIPKNVDLTKKPVYLRMGTNPFISAYTTHLHFGIDHWFCGDGTLGNIDPGIHDENHFDDIIITPLKIDLTDYEELEYWKNS